MYADVRKYLLKEHRHEVGEDRAKCRNCELERAADEMSAFELAAWNWYQRNALPIVFETGGLWRLIDKLGLDETRERFFIRAMNMVRQFALRIQIEDAGK